MHKLFKNLLLNTSAVLHDVEGAGLTPEQELAARREAALKTTKVVQAKEVPEKETPAAETAEEEMEEEEEETETVEETEEEKTARETKEAEENKLSVEDKEKRKQERIQRRIDKAVAGQRAAEAEVARMKALLDAKPPEEKLTKEEVEARAEALANEKLKTKEVERLQKEFNEACDKLQKEAIKLDDKFMTKVVDMSEELGAIPSRIIGILSDLDNGAEVLKLMADDIDEAEKLYDLQNRPEKLAIAIMRISDKLAAAKRPKPKDISKVPESVTPVTGSRSSSLVITQADTKDMAKYTAKRIAQREAQKKVRGY